MTQSIIRLTKKDLTGGGPHAALSDPEGIGAISPEKRAALESNPLSSSPDDPVTFLGVDDDTIVGRIDVIKAAVEIRGESIPIYWGSSLYVSEDHRKGGMGLNLLLQMQGMREVLGVSAVSQAAYPLYLKLGWTDFSFPRLMVINRSKAVLERFLRNALLAGAASKLVDGGLWIQRRLIALAARRGYRIREFSRAPQELDAILHSPKPYSTHRSAAWLDWVVSNQQSKLPKDRQSLFGVLDGSDKLIGYFLLKQRFFASASRHGYKNLLLCSLQEWRSLVPGALTTFDFLAFATRLMEEWDADALEIGVPDLDEAARLRKFGFVQIGTHKLLLRHHAKIKLSKAEFTNRKSWRYSAADGDSFIS